MIKPKWRKKDFAEIQKLIDKGLNTWQIMGVSGYGADDINAYRTAENPSELLGKPRFFNGEEKSKLVNRERENTIKATAKKYGVEQSTIYNWRKKYLDKPEGEIVSNIIGFNLPDAIAKHKTKLYCKAWA